MKQSIINQLNSVTSCTVEFDAKDKEVLIKKTIKITGKAMKVGSTYIIRLHENVTHPDETSSLAANWNNGVVPKYDTYIVEVLDNVAKMLKVNGVAIDNTSSMFMGWVPHDSFDVMQKL